MRHSLSEQAELMTGRVFKVVAQIAETYVFVYLGMAFVSYPIFENVDWSVRTRAQRSASRYHACSRRCRMYHHLLTRSED